MVKKLAKYFILSHSQDANYLVLLLIIQTVVLNTTFSGHILSQNQFDPIGSQAIGTLFYYFTSTPLLTT